MEASTWNGCTHERRIGPEPNLMRASAAAQHFKHLADTVEHGSGGQGNPIPTDRHYLRREGTNRYLPGHRASSCGVRANAGEIKPAQEWQAIATRNRRVQPIRSLKFSATSLTLGKEAGPQSGPCRSLIPSWRGLSCKIRWRAPYMPWPLVACAVE